MALVLTLLILATAGPILAEEMAREGSVSVRSSWTVSLTVLPMGEELAQMIYDGYGVGDSDTG